MVLRNYAQKEHLLQEQTDGASETNATNNVAGEAMAVEIEREVMGLVPIVSDVVLGGLKDMSPELFSRHAAELFPMINELNVVNSREVRLMVRDVLLHQVTPLLGSLSATSGTSKEAVVDRLP